MSYLEPNEWPMAYYNYLYRYAKFKINDNELIKDLVQDTFLDALESCDRFECRSSELTWLTAILKYKIYRVYRDRLKKKLIFVEHHELVTLQSVINPESFMTAFICDEHIIYKEFESSMKVFLATLPSKWQLLYNMKYINHKKSSEICERLSLSESNYWVISHRLKLTLTEWYLKHWN